MKKILKYLMLMIVATFSLTFTSCDKDEDDKVDGGGKITIVGKWADNYGTVTFGTDGSYREDNYDGQYRRGSYSYNSNSNILVVDVKAIAGNNGAYQSTYLVQTLTSSILVLLYPDGDVKGYYTRK